MHVYVLFILFIKCIHGLVEQRSLDGHGNNPRFPWWGQSFQPQRREWNEDALHYDTLPSTRTISRRLFSGDPLLTPHRISDFMVYFGQLVTHDISDTGQVNTSLPFHIPLTDEDDPFTDYATTLSFFKTMRTRSQSREDVMNKVTAYLDASVVYGSDTQRITHLRSFSRGELETSQGDWPPIRSRGGFLLGDPKGNVAPGLFLLQVALLREHNRRCRELAQRFPHMSDTQLFAAGRQWVMALLQKITFEEYAPRLLGQPLPPYRGYNISQEMQIDVFFSTCAQRYGHSAVNNLVQRMDADGHQHRMGHLLLRDVYFRPDIAQEAPEAFLWGMVYQPESQLDLTYGVDLREFFPEKHARKTRATLLFDMAAFDLQRGRDHGLPSYTTMRKVYGLPPVTTWEQLTPDPSLQQTLQELYGSIDNVEALVGALAEEPTATSKLGPLFTASITRQYTLLRDADRFYYKAPGILSPEELQELETMTLGKLLKLNFDLGDDFPDDVFTVYEKKTQAPPDTAPSALQTLKVLNDAVELSWEVQDDTLFMKMSVTPPGWVGIGFGSSMMRGADIVAGQWDGQTVEIKDFTGLAGAMVQDQERGGTQDITPLSHTLQGNTLTYHWKRLLAPPDTLDTPLDQGPVDVIVAYTPGQHPWGYHGPHRQRLGAIDFLEKNSQGATLRGGISEDLFRLLYTFHGAVMLLSFAGAIPLGIWTARYSARIKNWVAIHKGLMTFTATDSLFAVILVFITKGGAFSHPHHIMGVGITFLLLINIALGLLSQTSLTWVKTAAVQKAIRKGHGLAGWIILLLGLTNCTLGLHLLFREHQWIWKVFIVYCGVLFAVFLLLGECKLHHKISFHIGGKHIHFKKNTSSLKRDERSFTSLKIPWEELQKRIQLGEKLLIIGGKVFNVSTFVQNHPGGATPLLMAVGHDATGIFQGDTTRGIKTYAHSRFAHHQLEKFFVGVVAEELEKVSTELSLQREQKTTLLPYAFVYAKLIQKKVITSAPKPLIKVVFELEGDTEVCFTPNDLVMLKTLHHNQVIVRPYSPTKSCVKGHLEIMVRCVENGIMSTALMNASEGSYFALRGPVPRHENLLNEKRSDGCYENVLFVSSGSGIASILNYVDYYFTYSTLQNFKLKVIHRISQDEEKTLEEDFDDWKKKFPEVIQIHIDKVTWKSQLEEWITQDMTVFICGSSSFGNTVKDLLEGKIDRKNVYLL